MEKKFVKISELTALTGLTKSTIHKHIREGVIPTTKIGSVHLIPTWYIDRIISESSDPNGDE